MVYLMVIDNPFTGAGFPKDTEPTIPMAGETREELEEFALANAPDCKYSLWEQDGVSLRLIRKYGTSRDYEGIFKEGIKRLQNG